MSRYTWIHPDFENIEVGDKYVIQNSARFANRDDIYSRPVPVIRVTNTQFALENPHDEEKTINFTRSYGKSVGTFGNDYAKRATAEFLKEVDEYNKGVQDRKADERTEADKTETMMRERYGSVTIKNQSIQDLLQPIRRLAERGRKDVERFFEVTKAASVDEPWNVIHFMDHPGMESFKAGAFYKETAEGIHKRLVELVHAYEGGSTITNKQGGITIRYDKTDERTDGLLGVLALEINNTVNAMSDSYFNGFDKHEYEREFINDLREVAGVQYAYGRLTIEGE